MEYGEKILKYLREKKMAMHFLGKLPKCFATQLK
jgi:hypothetical protein